MCPGIAKIILNHVKLFMYFSGVSFYLCPSFSFRFSYSAQICVLMRFVWDPCIYSPHSIKIAYNSFLAPYMRCKCVTRGLYFYFSWKSPDLYPAFPIHRPGTIYVLCEPLPALLLYIKR